MTSITIHDSRVVNATPGDFPFIYLLFEQAIAFQKAHQYVGWSSYDKDFIKADVERGLLFKILKADTIICIFSVCFSDPLIWRDKEKGNALYLHRIVVNQAYRGQNTFKEVLNWAIQFAASQQLQYIRMDTWWDNAKIIGYYTGFGFRFVENYTTPSTNELPVQHRNLKVALLEYII